MHITMTGNLGSGKSTVCRLLEAKYGFEIFSTGKVIRQIADDMGISVLEMNELMSKDPKYDHMIDDRTATISRDNPDKPILFDSRLAWHFVPKSFKVFLSVDLAEAARRVYADATRGEVETYKSEADAAQQLAARAANEDARYEEIYGIHYFDFNNYNLILDSSYLPPERIADALIREASACDVWDGYNRTGRILVSPKRLGFEPTAEITWEHGYSYPMTVKVAVDGDHFTILEGAEYAQKAAEEGYAYVSAVL
ncbi:MAG: cytidylate kinase family protein [Lachnospiraceae bacterium]|nr:cytidylate kinase family protein [Lachnospiraceae bacterium]